MKITLDDDNDSENSIIIINFHTLFLNNCSKDQNFKITEESPDELTPTDNISSPPKLHNNKIPDSSSTTGIF